MNPEETSATRVLVIDDEPLIRRGLALVISADEGLEVCAEAGDGQSGIEAAHECNPDVVVMDLRMPVLDGVAATQALAEDGQWKCRPPAVLVLTTFDADEQVFAALRAGAAGYLLKSAAPGHLTDAIRAVAAGKGWLDPSASHAMITDFTSRPAEHLPPPEMTAALTRRECEILVTVAGGLSNGEIAERLFVGQGTVKTHIGRIFAKLGVRDRAQAVAVAYESGLVVRRRQHNAVTSSHPRMP